MDDNFKKWALLVPLALIWGSSFILIKRGLVGLSPIELGALRMCCASVFLIFVGFRHLGRIPLGKWKYLVLTALCGSFFPAFLFAIGQTRISSSISAVLNSLTPLNALLIGIVAYRLDYARVQKMGVAVGMLGSLLLIFGKSGANSWSDLGYVALVYLASVLYAANVNFIKAYLSDLKPLAISAGNAVVMLVPASVILMCSGFGQHVSAPEVVHSALFVAILGVVGTGIANIIFFRLIQISSPVFASSVTYLIPVVAFGWGLLDGESLNLLQVVGALIVLAGVYLGSRQISRA